MNWITSSRAWRGCARGRGRAREQNPWRLISKRAAQQQVPKGEMLIKQGDQGDYFYVVENVRSPLR